MTSGNIIIICCW